MYFLLRLAIIIILLIFVYFFIRKSRLKNKRRAWMVSFFIGTMLYCLLGFLPIENLFLTFDSPEAAFRYTDYNQYEPWIVVEGEKSTLVVANKEGNPLQRTSLILPKTEKGWKVGRTINEKSVDLGVEGELFYQISRYKNTNEYYLELKCRTQGDLQISDNRNSVFEVRELKEYALVDSDSKTYLCYAAISSPNTEYELYLDGKTIRLFEDETIFK